MPSKRPNRFPAEAKTEPSVRRVQPVRTGDHTAIREEVSANLSQDERCEPE